MKRSIFALMTIVLLISMVSAEETSLTVYNNDMAIVKIVDSMNFIKGVQTISFTDVADRIDPTSVRFSDRNGNVRVIEQNYRYDLVNSRKVLQKYIDRDISIWLKEDDLI